EDAVARRRHPFQEHEAADEGDHREQPDHRELLRAERADGAGGAVLEHVDVQRHQTCILMISWYASTARLRTATVSSTARLALEAAAVNSWRSLSCPVATCFPSESACCSAFSTFWRPAAKSSLPEPPAADVPCVCVSEPTPE